MVWPKGKSQIHHTDVRAPLDQGWKLSNERHRWRTVHQVRTALIGFTATSAALGMLVPAVYAQTMNLTWSKKNIDFNTYSAKGVSGYVENGTTYMPIWYVMQALNQTGYHTSFNGKVLSITAPSGVTPNTAGLVTGTGNFAIEINGQVVKHIRSEVHVDPASHKSTQFIPIYYIQQILSALSFYNNWDGTNWTGTPVNASIQGSGSVEEGQMVAFGLQLLNPDGSFFFPKGTVSWTESGPGQASIDKSTGVFSAATPGTYEVTARVDGFEWTKSLSVYGQAVGVNLSASKTSLVADGQDTSTITVHAVDNQGNVVPTFTGQVQLSIPSTGGTFVGGITSGNFNQVPVYLYNGTGTVTLTSPAASPQTAEDITASGLTSVSQTLPASPEYNTIALSYSAPVASQITITPSASALDNSSQNPVNLSLSLADAAGYPLTNSAYGGMTVTLSISGPGSFASGTSLTTTTTYINPGYTAPPIPVYPVAGQSGQITVTASVDGVTGATTLTSSSTFQTSQPLSLTSSQGTLASPLYTGTSTIPTGTPFTLYTVTTLDNNGNPLAQSDNLSISDSTTSSDTAGQSNGTEGLSYYSVTGNQPYQPLFLAGTNSYSLSTSSVTGKAQFIVFNTGNASQNTTITVQDMTRGTSATVALGAN